MKRLTNKDVIKELDELGIKWYMYDDKTIDFMAKFKFYNGHFYVYAKRDNNWIGRYKRVDVRDLCSLLVLYK